MRYDPLDPEAAERLARLQPHGNWAAPLSMESVASTRHVDVVMRRRDAEAAGVNFDLLGYHHPTKGHMGNMSTIYAVLRSLRRRGVEIPSPGVIKRLAYNPTRESWLVRIQSPLLDPSSHRDAPEANW